MKEIYTQITKIQVRNVSSCSSTIFGTATLHDARATRFTATSETCQQYHANDAFAFSLR